ncbi:ubiquitin carboxyl-terminal hydrolase CYLD isoform X2 [Wyeomyia smithii]|nr:ubiquitin carboxyl-terminal hydrolase CYLD isoform X2 [Wyeomyia smithii]XP_055546307.1 ubiquitin carboxyl-terminal hydrolase CYLD isoform X2 [Wyeomyia smithii]XP_055546308.1 ubiquitin carboxyl-terminal hydrolase CYLD isoform X2 [Wyeomyia smithii]
MTVTFAVSANSFRAKLVSLGHIKFEENKDDNNVTIEMGTTLQIEEVISGKLALVRIKNYYNTDDKTYENHLFQCPKSSLLIIPKEAWPFIIAIMDPQERVNFASQSKRLAMLERLSNDLIVKVSGRAFGLMTEVYDCIIRAIGPVPEIGPGYYLCMELLNLDHGHSPQKDDIPYLRKYVNTPPHLAFILAANWLDLNDTENIATTKHSKKKLFEDLLCGAKEQLNSRLNRGGAKRNPQHSKPINGSQDDSSTQPFTPEPSNQLNCSPTVESLETSQRKRMAASVSSPNLSKQDSSSSTGSSSRINYSHPTATMNEEMRYGDSQTEDSYRSGRSSQNSSTNSTLKLIKNRKKSSKPSTILSLEDRDIVVIDKADIKEATSSESDVIIVDPPPILPEQDHHEVDLKDVLGQDWPASAGGAAAILNSEKKTQTSLIGALAGGYSSSSSNSTNSNPYHAKYERNKSLNLLSHLASSKPTELNRRKEQKLMMDASTMAKPNDGVVPAYDNSNNIPHAVSSSSTSDASEVATYQSTLKEVPDNPLLELGSMVEVDLEKTELYGVIRWIGPLDSSSASSSNMRVMVGVELEDEPDNSSVEATDGVYNGIRLFRCPSNRAIFVHPSQCNRDRRFQDFGPTSQTQPKIVSTSSHSENNMFGKVDCPIVQGSVAPLKILQPGELEAICGKFKGIQGHHNSCYLDATLFAMFTFTGVFDSLLFRPREPEDNPQYEDVQRVLREEIVNPLRKNHFVRADRVMKLRKLLDQLSSVTGLTSEEKDPEEFLNSLLAQILRADPFLKLSSGLDTFYYQLFVEKDDQLKLPSVQQLFDQSFLTSNIKLKEVPSCLIIQMPRFGKNFKMYPRILPSQVLDVTDIIEDSPRQCTVCGNLAEHECRECFGMMQCGGVGLESTAFCRKCLETAHSHIKRQNHTPNPLTVPKDFKIMADHCPVPRLFMELFAVVCIETSHYVAFVKAASGQGAPWVFFDSMADRKGEQNGYNIPVMIPVPDLPMWLTEEYARHLNEEAINDKMLPEHAKRLLCDAYMCMYQSTDVMMYR